MIDFYMRGKLHLDGWISARISFAEINDGFANMNAGKTLRGVIMFEDSESRGFAAVRQSISTETARRNTVFCSLFHPTRPSSCSSQFSAPSARCLPR